ncbi:MAG: NADH-quinone oxidoreductase subunit M [Actinomycetaceae bacterium]|nr:NADH-quinone oxidoreductase subunit M [Actinomycetaceae bacterium]
MFTLMISLSALSALVLWLVKPLHRHARVFGLAVSLVMLACFIVVAAFFDTSVVSEMQFVETYPWIPQIGVSIAWGINGMGLVMVGLAVFLVPVVFVAAWGELENDTDYRAAGYVAWVLLLEAIMIGIFVARDVFVFYVLFELMIIPMYFLIGRYGGQNRRRAAIKFLLYSLAGGLVMLVGVIALYMYAGTMENPEQLYLVENLAGIIPSGTAQMWLFISFFIAFAIKAPMFPVHTWLPDTTAASRPGTSTLLVGVLDKIGAYGMIAFCLPLFPQASQAAAMPIMIFAVISIIWGGFAAIASKNLMRLIAFTSVSHFGFMILGIFSGSSIAMAGAIVYMVAHGVATGAMFLTVGFLGQRTGTYEISRYGGWQRVTPLIAGVFLVSGLATIAMPGLSGFIPEFMVLAGTFKVHPVLGICAVFGMLLAALYLLWPYQKVFTGPVPEDGASYKDMNIMEKVVSAVLIVAMFYLGFVPSGIVDVVTPVGEQSAALVSTGADDCIKDGSLDKEGCK